MLARLVLSIAALLTLSACQGDYPVMPAPGESYELSSLDQVCDGSLSARDVLDRVWPEYQATLRYHDRPGTTPIRIRVTYEGGELTCTPPPLDAPDGTGRPDVAAVAFVGIEVSISLLTADGALNESFVTTLGAANGTLVHWESPTFRPGELNGTWDPNLPGYDNVSFGFSGIFDSAQTSGNFIKGGQRPGFVPEGHFAATWRN